MAVNPARFEAHVRTLSRFGYTGVTPQDWLEHRRSGLPLPAKPVILTFDDAYAELCTHAFPVLERHGFRAAVYVVTGAIGGHATWAGTPGLSEFRLMDADEIRHWAGRGFEFGSHTRTHRRLAELSPPEIESELRRSHDDLVTIVGRPVTSLAYPHGSFDDRTVDCARRIYACAFTVRRGLADFSADPWRLSRLSIRPSDTSLDLLLSFRLGWSPIARVRSRAARLVGA